MVYAKTAIKQGLRILGRIDQKYNINKIFINKYVPPGYRKTVGKIFDVTGALGGGLGLYNLYESLTTSPGSTDYSPIPQITPSYNKYQKRGRKFKYSSRKYKYCYPNRKYNTRRSYSRRR